MDECKCCQCGNDTFWYLLSGEIRCTKCLKSYPNEFEEQIAALTNENKRLNAMLNHIAKEIHEIAQDALKETVANILHPEPLGKEFQKVLNEVPYEEEERRPPMTNQEKDQINRRFADLVGLPWHEYYQQQHDWYKCSCQKELIYKSDIIDGVHDNPDFISDPRLMLREMNRIGKLDKFLAKLNGLSLDEDGDLINNAVPVDYILDTAGLLVKAAISFLEKEK